MRKEEISRQLFPALGGRENGEIFQAEDKMSMTISAMPYVFTTNEILTLGIAVYAAVISTFVLGWDAYKWLVSGAKIDLSASSGMEIYGGFSPDTNKYVSVTALNLGDRPTTITNLGGMYFDSWWNAYITKRKPQQAFIITEPSQAQRIPYRFEVGDQWIGMAFRLRTLLRRRGMDTYSSFFTPLTEAGELGFGFEFVQVNQKSKHVRRPLYQLQPLAKLSL